MKIDNRAWLTLYDPDYNDDEYLYHFTSIDAATKILYDESLKFSKLCRTNDTLESKPKIFFEGLSNKQDVFDLRRHIMELNNDMLQLLCFTMDYAKLDSNVNDKTKYSDYSGRGFSLPRMWAQYARNNSGVCMVFKRKEIIRLIKKSLGISLIHLNKITYYDQFKEFPMGKEISERLLARIRKNNSILEKGLTSLDFLKENIDLVMYCYFSKLDDWKGENEYRFLALGDEEYIIDGIANALRGVIIGEKMSPENQKIISFFCDDICEVKQITFTCNGCNLVNIRND